MKLRGLLVVPALALLTAACGGASGTKVGVEATDSACTPAKTRLTLGKTTFAVHNTGSKVTEMYVYAPGDKIKGEVEDIGPGTTRTLSVTLAAGKYQLACKPGQKGSGIRTDIEVEN